MIREVKRLRKELDRLVSELKPSKPSDDKAEK